MYVLGSKGPRVAWSVKHRLVKQQEARQDSVEIQIEAHASLAMSTSASM